MYSYVNLHGSVQVKANEKQKLWTLLKEILDDNLANKMHFNDETLYHLQMPLHVLLFNMLNAEPPKCTEKNYILQITPSKTL